MTRLLLLVVSLTFLQACGMGDRVKTYFGGEDNTEPPTPLVEFEPTVEVVTQWSRRIGRGAEDYFLKLTPTISDERIYAVAHNGTITALNHANGSTVWEKRIRDPISSPAGVGETLVVVGTSRGQVFAFDRDTGEERWESRVTSEVLATPQVAEGIVVVRSIDGNLAGLDAQSGERLWIYDRSVPALSLRGNSAPVIDRSRGIVIVGFDEGRLIALELRSGQALWEVRIAVGSGRSEMERMVDVNADPVLRDGVIYVTSYQGQVVAISLDGARMLWNREIPSHTGLTLDDSSVYVTDDDRLLWALEQFSGSSLWQSEDLRARATSAPAVIGPYLVVGDLEGYVHWMDKTDGRFVARTRIDDSPVLAAPISHNNTVYVYSQAGTLSAYTYR